jgi:UDP-glucuronate decarboxylase
LHGAVNIGNTTEITIAELAKRIIDISGSRSTIERMSLPQDDPKQRRPDITRAEQLLNWQPRVALEEGLRRTIAYFDELLASDTPAIHELPSRAA